MKTLLLLRHGKSSRAVSGQKDFNRPLEDRGDEGATLIGMHLQAVGLVPDAIISSPALRASQTADCIVEATAGAGAPSPGLNFDKRLYEAPTEAILQVARSAGNEPEVLMLVGHNPSMQMAALKFWGTGEIALHDDLLRSFPTAALASFTFDVAHWRDISWAGARPLGLTSPKALRGCS